MKRWIQIGAACLLAAAAAAAGFALIPRDGQGEEAVRAAWMGLSPTAIEKTIASSGRISSQETGSVTAPTDRVVKSVSAALGQQVKKGQILAELDVSGLRLELEKARRNASSELQEAQRNAEAKERDYENAKFSAELGELSQEDLLKAQRELETARSALEEKRNGGQNEQLLRQIGEGVLRAPVSGTITAVNAEAGAVSSGVLFTIEDTERLQVTAFVSEYDVNTLRPGMKAVIKTEMTGEERFEGQVLTVAPAAVKNQGEKSGGGKVQFQVIVGITEGGKGIRIGGNAQVTIIAEQKDGVFAVPFEALVRAQGETSVLAAEKQGQEYVVKKIDVTTGLESDTAVEVSGPELKEGLRILKAPEDLVPGQPIEIIEVDEGEEK